MFPSFERAFSTTMSAMSANCDTAFDSIELAFQVNALLASLVADCKSLPTCINMRMTYQICYYAL